MTSPHRLCGVLLAGVAAVILGACAPGVVSGPVVTMTASPKEDRVAVPPPPEDPMPDQIWPLTGLSAVGVAEDDLNRVAVAVKIDNHPYARPPKSLEYADIVFEEYMDYNQTRFIAVFHSTYPEEIGPIRSMRPMDPDIIGSFYVPLVFSGASRSVVWEAQKTDQVLISNDFGDDGFFRTRAKPAPHNLYGTTSVFAEQAVQEGIPPASRQFEYAYPAETATAAVEGTPIGTIDLKFSPDSHPAWEWDEATRVWMRYEKGKAFDSVDGVQISAENVIILRVDVHYVYTIIPMSDVIVEDAPGYVATDGRITEIRWSKSGRRDPFVLTTLEGDLVTLEPGQTWVEIVPLHGARSTITLKFDGVVQTR